MSKRAFFKRYIWLFDTINSHPFISLKEINEKFNNSILWRDETSGFSKRTFHRDINEIEELFGIEIIYNKSKEGYFVNTEFLDSSASLLIESYRVITALEHSNSICNYITVIRTRIINCFN